MNLTHKKVIPPEIKQPSWIIPNLGCCEKNTLGKKCMGSKEINFNKYCGTCTCLYSINVFNSFKGIDTNNRTKQDYLMFSITIFILTIIYCLIGIGFTRISIYLYKDDMLPTLILVLLWPLLLIIYAFFHDDKFDEVEW